MSILANVRLAYAEAYAIKTDMGGGYRGVAKNMLTNEILKGERRDSWKCNYFIRADEA